MSKGTDLLFIQKKNTWVHSRTRLSIRKTVPCVLEQCYVNLDMPKNNSLKSSMQVGEFTTRVYGEPMLLILEYHVDGFRRTIDRCAHNSG